ncbi:putative CRISPR-associated protein [Limnospira indica]|uniref:CRISPR-associated protein, APE2256 family n=1 Tax=Limnospira indica PCC 8005 TaxID=376219 RepID=A0A9P1NZV2_9CYAN|nr:putative CRISPR-associated protein [Limnospira indica]CDM96273.1 putative CRISPR-associated protein, APE2256 family [Limnospira indica PCC 8005]
MRNTLICTVGTSLLNNLKRSDDAAIQGAFNAQNWKQLSLLLLERRNTDRLCGAEINSIASICDKGFLADRNRLIFLVSDTDDGRAMGNLLKLYFDYTRNPLNFQQVEYRVLTGLRDDSVQDFRQKGLKNLVKEISTEVRTFSPEAIAINATGGYKAQISFAGMIGQALGIPVYYLFEKFSEVIELPPQPVALDLAFWLNNYLLFEYLETEQTAEVSLVESDIDDPYLSSLIDREDDLISLSAMGVLFNERSRLQFAKQETAILALIPQDDTKPEAKNISLRDDHGKDVLMAFSQKVCRSPYVKKIVNSLPFNPHQKTPIRRTYPNGIVEFVLTWTDAGYGICIQTTGRNLAETNTIAIHLQQEFSQ